MIAVWDTLFQVGGSLLGGLFDSKGQSDANAANLARFMQAMQYLKGASVRQNILFNRSEDILRARQRLVLGDIKRAEAETRMGTRQAEQAVHDQAIKAKGELTQGLVGRGLATSSVAGNAQRALAADIGRSIGAIRQQQGARLASLALARAQTRGGLMQDVASLAERRAGAEVDMAQRFVDLLSSVHDTYQSSGMGKNLGILGGLLGGEIDNAGGLGGFFSSLFGGGGGGGGGGES
ncbi:MAG: hypothetical protein D6746_08470 [Bacteroidetes bacterium]|nr:MAG: hypothetical protein D6746_08470 [Bacteroidota bacterium]